jgi:hypothetical protein
MELFDTNKIQNLNSFQVSEIKASVTYFREFGAEIVFAARILFLNLHKHEVTSWNIETFMKRKREALKKETTFKVYFPWHVSIRMPRLVRTICRYLKMGESG